MRKRFVASFISVVCSSVVASCTSQRQPHVVGSWVTPTDLAKEAWELHLQHDPLEATFLGDRRFDDKLPDLRPEILKEYQTHLHDLRERLRALPQAEQSPQDQITAALLDFWATSRLDAEVCHSELWEIDQLRGYQVTITELSSYQRIDSEQAGRHFVVRLRAVRSLFEQHIANLRAGYQTGYTAPRVAVERVVAQLQPMFSGPVDKSPYLAILDRSDALTAQQVAQLRKEILEIVGSEIYPALRHYHDFLKNEYLPKARTAVGVIANTHGKECYDALVRLHTTTRRTPEDIHQLGLQEIDRINRAMHDIAATQGVGSFHSYADKLRKDPKNYLKDRQALLQHNEELVARSTAKLPQVFGTLPPIACGIKAIEAYAEQDSPAAYYYAAADDGSRPAYYYVNTFEPHTRPLFNMEALAYHESVPGHHLQISIAQNLKNLPDLRRHAGTTAFVEGWALYAELVADELGLYSAPSTRFGMLNYQAWRAARLVVDTGMHVLGWSREQAVAFMKEHVILPDAEIANEIDRYIVWPGQALAYTVGRLFIQKLRADEERRFGAAFDIRAFHDRLLENGALPLAVIEQLFASKH